MKKKPFQPVTDLNAIRKFYGLPEEKRDSITAKPIVHPNSASEPATRPMADVATQPKLQNPSQAKKKKKRNEGVDALTVVRSGIKEG